MKKILVLFIGVNLLIIIILPILVTSLSNLLQSNHYQVEIYNTKSKEVIKIDLEDYLKGVVAAEMPAQFDIEALKAQAIATRTYTLRRSREKTITTDSTKDQAWLSNKELLKKWGLKGYFNYWSKVSQAVEDTAGLVLVYDGDLITSVYHSASGDYTAAAKEVWGNDVPYLQSVVSNYEENSPYYKRKQNYSISELYQRLGIEREDIDRLQITKRSSSGRVLKLQVGDEYFSGREIRRKLGLPSTNFMIKSATNSFKIISSGYGHGVGMSQYGANGMAEHGYNFKKILDHYYPRTKLKSIW